MKRLALFLLAALRLCAAPTWREVLEQRLPYYGHRNWIVIADSAYPLQSGLGIETILSNESQIDTVRQVLNALAKAAHVRPIVYTDRELPVVSDLDAPGIAAYRQLLTGIFENKLPGQKIETLPHIDVIQKLDVAAKEFNVLIIKTNMTLPYTSVFLELRAAYWSDEAEDRLRQAVR